jgi:hypothetical protein
VFPSKKIPKHEKLLRLILYINNISRSSVVIRHLYSSPDTIMQDKSRRMRWAGHVARMGEERKVYRVLVGKPKGKRPLGRPGVGGNMGSEWILVRLAWGVWIGFHCLRTGTGGGLL